MKLKSFFVLASFCMMAGGCTKDASPEFEASVSEWAKGLCSCLEGPSTARCEREQPQAELSGAEGLMANAGLLTDKRRELIRRAQDQVRGCDERSRANHAKLELERETQKLMNEARAESEPKKPSPTPKRR